MQIRLTFEERAALQWFAGWHARRLGDPLWYQRMFSRLGVEALAALVPPESVSRERPALRRGAPRGPHRIGASVVEVPDSLRPRLAALAAVFDVERPQEVVAAIASEIHRRAPGVALDVGGDENLHAIEGLVRELRALLLAEASKRGVPSCGS